MGTDILEKAESKADKPAGSPGLRASGAKWLLVMATIYAFWLAWLMYVGVVNYRAGNQ